MKTHPWKLAIVSFGVMSPQAFWWDQGLPVGFHNDAVPPGILPRQAVHTPNALMARGWLPAEGRR